MHSTFSPDGDHSPAQLCQRALELGLTEIAITEHAEWQPASSLHDFSQVAAYFAALEPPSSRARRNGATFPAC